eukprot:scaffold175743_cov37-Prasinocladus_malaysianus.AAC.1
MQSNRIAQCISFDLCHYMCFGGQLYTVRSARLIDNHCSELSTLATQQGSMGVKLKKKNKTKASLST